MGSRPQSPAPHASQEAQPTWQSRFLRRARHRMLLALTVLASLVLTAMPLAPAGAGLDGDGVDASDLDFDNDGIPNADECWQPDPPAPLPDSLRDDGDLAFDMTPRSAGDAQEIVNFLFGVDMADRTSAVELRGGATNGTSQVALVTDLDQIADVQNAPGAFADFSQALMMSTGPIGKVQLRNTNNYYGAWHRDLKDDDFDDGTGDFDVATLEFTVDLAESQDFTGKYVFASEEYLEYVGYGVNDGALVLVNGTNVALAADGRQVSIDTINDTQNREQFVDNRYSKPSVKFEPDGFTTTLDFTAPLNEGENTIKIGIADRGDGWLDSWFFFAAGSFEIPELSCDSDIDGDGIQNALDLDSDNDGISDLAESGFGAALGIDLDADLDGVIDAMADPSTADLDGDGLADVIASAMTSGLIDGPVDTDADGIDDLHDLDADNDGIPDIVEVQPTSTYVALSGSDSDADGIDDSFDSVVGHGGGFTSPTNTDGAADGPDHLDLDADNDGVSDQDESGLTLSGSDADRDGIDDAVGASISDPDGIVNTPSTDLANAEGTDLTEVSYREGNDQDGDGIADVDEKPGDETDPCSAAEHPDFVAPASNDCDNDGVTVGAGDLDDYDPCADAETTQLCVDSDGDGIVDDDEGPGEETDPCADSSNPDYSEPVGADCAASDKVEREVAFLIDGSLSIDDKDWAIQLDGIANTLLDTSVFPADGTTAVAVVQWSDGAFIEVPYTVLESSLAVANVVAAVKSIGQNLGGTSPEAGIQKGLDVLLGSQGSSAADKVLCLSTDGKPVSPSAVLAAAAGAEATSVARLSVLAMEDPSREFHSAQAHQYYDDAVFGGGNVVISRNAAEFSSLITAGCLSDQVSLVGLEVNQAIQDWTGSIPLVEAKSTVVRVFFESLDSEDDRIVARLHGERNGVALPSSPIVAMNNGSSVLASRNVELRRADFDASLNFSLPKSWLNGDVTLSVEVVGGEPVCAEAVAPANTCSADVSFTSVPDPQARLVRIGYRSDGKNLRPTGAEAHEQARRIESALPIANLVYKQRFLKTGWTTTPTAAEIVADLMDMRTLDGASTIYLGVLDGVGTSGPSEAAIADPLVTGASFFIDDKGAKASEGLGRNNAVAAFSEALGALPATDESGDAVCADLGPLGDSDTEVWGIDTRFVRSSAALAVIDPTAVFSVMSGCAPTNDASQGRWLGSANYAPMIEVLNAIDWSASGGVQSENTYDLIRGSFTFDSAGEQLSLEFDDTFEVTTTVDLTNLTDAAPGAGDDGQRFGVELLDADGVVVMALPFEPQPLPSDPGTEQAAFSVPVEDAPDYAAIAITRDGERVGLLQASDNAPTVAILTPIAGDVVRSSDLEVTWDSADADGDELSHIVQYSIDNGSTWQTVALGIDETFVSVPRDALQGSEMAKVRVLASDGVLSTVAESGTFTIANAAPELTILSPEDSDRFDGVQTISFEAEAIDAEDGLLDGAGITWESDLDGPMGSGAEIVTTADLLSEGMHRISARVTDSDGQSVSAIVDLQISRVAEPTQAPMLCQGFEVTVDLANGDTPTDGDDVILGTSGDDLIVALAGNDIICAGGGADVVYGQAGDDQIFGGSGNDRLRGGADNDLLFGGGGEDDLAGGRGDDEVYGESGNDVAVRGGTGDDLVHGGDGDDVLVAGNGGSDMVYGGAGNDKVTGGPRPDMVDGGDGNDEVKGNGGGDTLLGGAGDDDLRGGKQGDSLDGGEGVDVCNGGTTGGGAGEFDTALATCETTTNAP